MLFDPQNPGIGGLKELTTDEELLVGDLNSISRDKGTIIAGNNSTLVGLVVGDNGQVLKANSATATGLEWSESVDSDEKVKYDAADPTAGYVADKIIAGTGISIAEGTGANENKSVITNSSPDQTVAITAGTNIDSVTGTYPNFTINASTQATRALDNLDSVAINTSLISDTDSTDDLGSSTKQWANVYTDRLISSVSDLVIENDLSDGDISFKVNDGGVDTTVMTLDGATGNVGIGTISPSEKLDVVGNINIPTTSSTVGQIKINGNRYFHAYSPGVAGTNLFVGYNSGNFTMSGTGSEASYNTGVGRDTLKSLTTGEQNSAQGYRALYSNTTGNSNSAQGVNALFYNTTGNSNSAQGVNALFYNTTGDSNSAQGYRALQNNTTGDSNSAQGYRALYNLTGAYSNNTALGFNAGRYYNGTTGNLTDISNSVIIGAQTSSLNGTGDTNEIVIGYNAIGLGSNSVILGNSDITTTALRGNVGIGTTAPTAVLHLKAGTATASTAPIKLTQAGAVVLGTPEAGTIECNDGDLLYYTIKTGPTRKTIAFTDTAPASHAASHAVGAADTVFPADPNADKFLKWDDDPGALVWADAPAPEGTAVLSTGETGGTKFLREDGDGTCSWQTVSAGAGDVTGPAANTADYIPQWNGADSKTLKDGLAVPTGGLAGLTSPTFATSVTGSYLTASEILITDADKKIVSAPVATYPSLTELSYVKGLSSAVQTQIGNKANSASPTFTGTVTLPKAVNIKDTSADHEYQLGVSELTANRTVTLPLLTGNDTYVFQAHTQTLTNKRVTKRITALTSHATPTINTDNCDAVDITALEEDITNMTTNLSGTPTNKQTLLFEIKDNGTARDITWGTGFVAGGVALPTTTVKSKILTVGFIYSTANALNKWRCVAVAQEA